MIPKHHSGKAVTSFEHVGSLQMFSCCLKFQWTQSLRNPVTFVLTIQQQLFKSQVWCGITLWWS